MKAKTEAEYQEWVRDVESKLGEADKAAFRQLAGAPVGKEVFGGYLREADYYKRLNEYNEEKRRLEGERTRFDQDVAAVDQWFQKEEPKNRQLAQQATALQTQLRATEERLRSLGLEDEIPATTRGEANVGRQTDDALRGEVEQLKQQLGVMNMAVNRALPRILGDYGKVLQRLQKDGYDLDPSQLIEHAATTGVDLSRAYDELTADARVKRDEVKMQKELEKAKEEGRREALSKIPAAASFKPSGPTIIDKLTGTPSGQSQSGVDRAVQSFLELSSGQG